MSRVCINLQCAEHGRPRAVREHYCLRCGQLLAVLPQAPLRWWISLALIAAGLLAAAVSLLAA